MEMWARMDEYLVSRGCPCKLLDGEVPFAVFWVKSDEEQTIRALAIDLQTWIQKNTGASRILGLEQMLAGKHPETATKLLEISFTSDPKSWTELVALVLLKRDASREEMAASLHAVTGRHEGVYLFSFEQYGFMTR